MMASMHDIAPQQEAQAQPEATEENDALAEAYEADAQAEVTEDVVEPEPQEEAKPAGLMFVRHSRNQNRVA